MVQTIFAQSAITASDVDDRIIGDVAPPAETFCVRMANMGPDADAAGEKAADYWLGLVGSAGRRVKLPDDPGAFEPLTVAETVIFLRSLARLLATEDILLPPEPFKPWEWPV